MRNSNMTLIRSLVSSVILEGFRDDQARLSELYPEHAQEINNLQPKWIAWLSARFGDSPRIKEVHPFGDSIVTVVNFAKKDSALVAKYRDSEQFRAAVDTQFPPEKRQWQSPNDVTSMTVDEMEMILSLSERKKQRFDVDRNDMGFEGDRIGKVGPWNLWMPTTRENSCNIVGSDPTTLEPKTTWCTARTSGSNLFYNYVGRPGYEITLFYVIRDEPREPSDWLSVGFVNGKPVLDGQRGGVSVDRANNGLTQANLRSALGSDYSEIMTILTQKNESLGGKHPARQKIADATKSVKALEYLVKGLSKEEASDLKMMVVKEPDLSVEVALLLSGDDDKHVRLRVARRENLPLEALARLVSDDSGNVRMGVACNPNVPPDVLTRFVSDEDRNVRMGVAYNKSTPPEALARLANDRDQSVRVNLARNPNTPPDVLTRLTSDDDLGVRMYVASNKNTLPEALARLARDKHIDVRMGVTKNENTPPEALARLARDKSNFVKANVASNPNAPPDALTRLASDEDVSVRLGVARNPNTPPDVLTRLASDEYYEVRLRVASNPNIPVESLNELAWDMYKGIRDSAHKNPSTPIETLRKVAQHPNISRDEWEELMKIIRQREATNESLLRSLIRRIV